MKIKKRNKLTFEKFNEYVIELDNLAKNYTENDFKKLSRIAFLIASVVEYLSANKSVNALLYNHFESTYKNDFCLVLSETQVICRDKMKLMPNDSQQAFSRNKIIKFLRGEHAHLNEIPDDAKFKILNSFIHEEGKYLAIFAIGHNFIRTPIFIEHKNVGDSEGAILHSYETANGNIEHLSTIESIVINIYKEIADIATHKRINWSKAQIGEPDKTTKTLFPMLKEHISENILKQISNWEKWRNWKK